MNRRTDCVKQQKPIGIMPYFGIFIVWIGIIVFAFLVFLIELILAKKKPISKSVETFVSSKTQRSRSI